MLMSEYINIKNEDRIKFICINRPDKKNALDMAMYSALAQALQDADADKNIRVSYLTGVADAFCSGNDISDFLKNPPVDESSPVIKFINALINAEKPIVAAVNGIAVGIGTTMLLHCDLVYASDAAQFQLPFVNIGLCPEAGSTYILSTLIGHQKASELLLLGDRFSAEQAEQFGFVNKVVSESELETNAMKSAKRIAEQPPNATKVTKELMRSTMRAQIIDAKQRELASFIPMLDGAEAKEALTAFMEKRKSDFSSFE
ncbi:MAG: enoyl-CoA hydratase/carnithine racemase [Gammaproteobacteria bacterium]|jgi:enoyl-CoA hydratase/carnithine racemase